MTVSRRELLERAGAAGALVALGGVPGLARPRVARASSGWTIPPGFDYPVAPLVELPFAHGVASGDPLADRVILWTRLTLPDPEAHAEVEVEWRAATDPRMTKVVASGSVRTDASRDWTVKVDAAGLAPRTTYFYAFSALGRRSLLGRTRTAPSGVVDDVRIAVVACSSYWSGYFNAYRQIASRNDLDLVVHCGDHIYDDPDDQEWVRARGGRFDPGYVDFRDWQSLDENRRRYALYYADPDLVALHRSHPISIVWDNHDLSSASAQARADSMRAFWEWTPTRPPRGDGSGTFAPASEGQVDPENPELLYRHLSYGQMADILLIDTRHIGRERRTDGNFSTRRLLGDTQLQWLTAASRDSAQRGVTWRFVVNQVLMGQLRLANLPGEGFLPFEPQYREGLAFNPDQWDGYPAERDLLFGTWRDDGVRDMLVATGDMHGNFCHDLVENPARPWYRPADGRGRLGSVGVEFAPSSVGRGGLDETVAGALYEARHGRAPERDRVGFEVLRRSTLPVSDAVENGLRAVNHNLRYAQWTSHGYGVAHLTRDAAWLEYWWQPILLPGLREQLGAQMVVRRGTNHAEQRLVPMRTVGREHASSVL